MNCLIWQDFFSNQGINFFRREIPCYQLTKPVGFTMVSIDNIKPHSKYLEIRMVSMSEHDEYSWKAGRVNYNYNEIYGVPILAFLFQNGFSNFFEHINYHELKKLGPSSWLRVNKIIVILSLFDETATRVLQSRVVILSPEDSNRLRLACQNQQSRTSDQIEASVDFLYELYVHDLDWLY